MKKPDISQPDLESAFRMPIRRLLELDETQIHQLLAQADFMSRWLRGVLRLKPRKETPKMSHENFKKLRSDAHFSSLPESVRIPPIGDRQSEIIKPIELASLDEIAFAVIGVEAEVDALNSRFYALRRLYNAARARGAFGSQNAVDIVASDKGGN
jgi:hypothetical protein